MKTNIKQGHLNEVFCLKHGSDMNDFSLKRDPLSGFEGLGSIPLPKLPLSVVSPPLQGLKVFGAYLYPNFPWVPPHPTPGFEGLGSIPLPKLPLSAPTPHPRVWRSWEHTSTQTSLQCPHPCPTSTGHFPSLGPEQGGHCSVFVIATTYYAGIQRNLYIMKSQGSDKICSL